MWGAKIANKLLGTGAEGLSSIAMQQGGIGLLLTALIVSVPPMAAMFFQGTLGSFMSYSAFGGGGNGIGPSGQPPGAWSAHRSAGGDSGHSPSRVEGQGGTHFAPRVASAMEPVEHIDTIKSSPSRVRGDG